MALGTRGEKGLDLRGARSLGQSARVELGVPEHPGVGEVRQAHARVGHLDGRQRADPRVEKGELRRLERHQCDPRGAAPGGAGVEAVAPGKVGVSEIHVGEVVRLDGPRGARRLDTTDHRAEQPGDVAGTQQARHQLARVELIRTVGPDRDPQPYPPAAFAGRRRLGERDEAASHPQAGTAAARSLADRREVSRQHPAAGSHPAQCVDGAYGSGCLRDARSVRQHLLVHHREPVRRYRDAAAGQLGRHEARVEGRRHGSRGEMVPRRCERRVQRHGAGEARLSPSTSPTMKYS